LLATGEDRYAAMLEDQADTITAHFPDYDNSPFVQEKFFGDWSKDQHYGQQQNRAIVGHNLKIAWNLMRINSLRPKAEYVAFAEKIAAAMPSVGADPQRGGWYDMVERVVAPGERFHRLVWHDRKAWWQQEQGILAYLLLHGVFGRPEYARMVSMRIIQASLALACRVTTIPITYSPDRSVTLTAAPLNPRSTRGSEPGSGSS